MLYFPGCFEGHILMTGEELYQRGFDARCNGQYREARTYLEQVLVQNPTHADARWQIGLIQGFEGDFDGSFATLQKLVQDNPSHLNARYDLAMTMMMLGMIDEACAEFHEILRRDPTHDNAKKQIIYCP